MQESESSLGGFLKEEKRTIYGIIRTLIEDDEDSIEDANRDVRDSEMWHEMFRKSPDMFANPDDQS